MNERIMELAEQAGLLGPSSRVGNAHEATKKFAMLIINECVDVAMREDHDPAECIKSHFGVELEGKEE